MPTAPRRTVVLPQKVQSYRECCWISSFLHCLRREEPYLTPYLPVIPTFFVRLVLELVVFVDEGGCYHVCVCVVVIALARCLEFGPQKVLLEVQRFQSLKSPNALSRKSLLRMSPSHCLCRLCHVALSPRHTLYQVLTLCLLCVLS